MSKSKILMCTVFAEAFYKSRRELILEFIKKGYEVILLAPEPEELVKNKIDGQGIRYYQISLDRTGLNPFKDYNVIKEIKNIINMEKPCLVYSFGGAKAAIYTTLAASKGSASRNYCMINGLGSIFRGDGLRNKLIKIIMSILFRYSLSKSNGVLFQNVDDLEEFSSQGLVNKNKCIVVNGSGVNLKRFPYTPIKAKNVFLFVGRLLRDKGIYEFVEAAKKVKVKHPNTEFWVVGGIDTNPTAAKETEIMEWVEKGLIKYFGRQEKVLPYYQGCSVFVLPSYHEGTPRTNLEAMAVGRPVITTEAPGCKETVVHGETGFLIPIKDSSLLAEKMEYFVENPIKIHDMGLKAFQFVSKKYDVNKVNQSIINFLLK